MSKHTRPDASDGTAGFTLLETMITLAVFSVIFSSLFMVVHGVRTSYDQRNTFSTLQESGRRILKEMIGDLRQTGILTDGAVNLPAIYERARAPLGAGSERGPLIATMSFTDADLGGVVFSGPSRVEQYVNRTSNEIVFRRLEDLDGKAYFIDEATGELEWGETEYSYYVGVGSDGIPQLVREANTGEMRVVGRYVEKVIFDVISYDPTVYYNQIVIVLYMRRTLPNGEVVRVGLEGTVNLRNTSELE